MRANSLKSLVVGAAVSLEMEAHVKPRIRKSAVRDQNQCDEHTADPAIPVEKWVNRLELSVHESCLQQSGDAVVMQEHLEIAERGYYLMSRRWNERGVARTTPSDPVLRGPELSWYLFGPPAPGHKYSVHLANQTEAHG